MVHPKDRIKGQNKATLFFFMTASENSLLGARPFLVLGQNLWQIPYLTCTVLDHAKSFYVLWMETLRRKRSIVIATLLSHLKLLSLPPHQFTGVPILFEV